MTETYTDWIKTISLPSPTLQDNTADADRLKRALSEQLGLGEVDIDFPVLKNLPDLLRKCDFNVRCVLIYTYNRWVVTQVLPPDDLEPLAGLAIDLGTTRISLQLINLSNGETIADISFLNPQVSVGPDILTRIHFAGRNNGLTRLSEMVNCKLNHSISELCSACYLKPEHIHFLTIAGNTTMTHLLMGINPCWMIREPYIPVTNTPGFILADKLGLAVAPGARIYIFPNRGSYFGGDLIAGILFSGIHRREEISILVDVGTNAEVVLGNKDWLVACAGAAGPALEGDVTQMGMLADPGVIDRIQVHSGKKGFDIHTIGDLTPTGICGSGLIELAAQLFLTGMIDSRGKFIKDNCMNLLKTVEGILNMIIVPAHQSGTGCDLSISQIELDSLFRSKAAMFTILETITSSVGISFEELSTFYIAGNFGAFINPRSAISIGMLPDLPMERFISLGNSALAGAAMVLSSKASLEEIKRIKEHITYMELNVNQEFMNRFSAAKFLPHTDRSRFPSVKVKATI